MILRMRSPLLIIAFTNVLIIFTSHFYWYKFWQVDDLFGFFHLPLIVVIINLLLWIQKMRLTFYLQWVVLYISYYGSILLILLIESFQVEPLDHGPSGEAVFDLFMTGAVFSFFQLFILIFLNGITFFLYNGGFRKA